MALKWFDGGEAWGTTFIGRAYFSTSSVSTGSSPRTAPGVRHINCNGVMQPPSLGLQNTWVMAFGLYLTSAASPVWEYRLMSGSGIQCTVKSASISGGYKLQIFRGATLIAETGAISLNAWNHIAIKLTVRTSTNGAYEIRQNEVSILSGSGVNLADQGTDGADNHAWGHFGSPSGDTRMDDIYILDTTGAENNDFLGDCVCVGLLPNADGATNNWSVEPTSPTTHYDKVDDPATAANDSDYVYSDTNTQRELYEFENLPATGVGTIFGVRFSVSASMEATGSRTLRTKFRSSGGTVASGDDVTVGSTSIAELPVIYQKNPVTAVAWVAADIDGGQFGMDVQS